MKRSLRVVWSALGMTLIGIGVWAALAPAQTDGPANGRGGRGMMMSPGQWQSMAERSGMSPGMIMRWRTLNAMRADAYDPETVLAYQTGLQLTPDQVAKIGKIAEDARAQVKSVLTQEQIDKLQPMTSGPQTMWQMQRWMMNNRGNGDFDFYRDMPMMFSPAATQPSGDDWQRQRYPLNSCPMYSR